MGSADEVIKAMESSAVKKFTALAMKGLTEQVWAGFAYPVLGPVVGYFVGIVVGILATYTDWLAYMLVDNWKNTAEGRRFEESVARLEALPGNTTEAERLRLEQEQIDAFTRLISLGSPPTP